MLAYDPGRPEDRIEQPAGEEDAEGPGVAARFRFHFLRWMVVPHQHSSRGRLGLVCLPVALALSSQTRKELQFSPTLSQALEWEESLCINV